MKLKKKIRHLGISDLRARYSVLISFKVGSFFSPVAIIHYSNYSDVENFLHQFNCARKIIFKCSSSIVGAPFPRFSVRWFASHNTKIFIVDQSISVPHKVIFEEVFIAPYLKKINDTRDGDDTDDRQRDTEPKNKLF